VRVEVKDAAAGRLVDAGAVSLGLTMTMPGMNMQAQAVLQKGEQAGVYSATMRPGNGSGASVMTDQKAKRKRP